MEELFKKCDHSHIQYIPALNEWLCLKCRAFSKDKGRFDFQPLPQPKEVTDEEIEQEKMNRYHNTQMQSYIDKNHLKTGFFAGAKWMRDQMKGGTK